MSKTNFQPGPAKKARRRASCVCRERDHVLMVRLRDPLTGIERWLPPGGMMEEGESPETCAIRETAEETGFRVRPWRSSPSGAHGGRVTIRYDYEWNGIVYDCVTHFVRCELAEEFRAPEKVHDADFNKGAQWLPLSEVSDALAFHQPIRQAVLDVLGLG